MKTIYILSIVAFYSCNSIQSKQMVVLDNKEQTKYKKTSITDDNFIIKISEKELPNLLTDSLLIDFSKKTKLVKNEFGNYFDTIFTYTKKQNTIKSIRQKKKNSL